jgi:hypothetical protein
MTRRPRRRSDAATGDLNYGEAQARAWLGAEIELIIQERERLLRAAGAAAAVFTALDPESIPSEARALVGNLGAVLETLSEETLTDAIEMSIGQRADLGFTVPH